MKIHIKLIIFQQLPYLAKDIPRQLNRQLFQ